MGWRVTPGKWAAGLGRERGNGALSAVAENGAEIYAAGKHGLGRRNQNRDKETPDLMKKNQNNQQLNQET
jgi:hypothetical protein